jgi:hypothetical protein
MQNANAQRQEKDKNFCCMTGALTLAVDTHFMSYGADVWAAGTSFSDPLIHPQMDYNYQLTESTSLILGAWLDLNDNGGGNIGTNKVQEVDLWAGIGTTIGSTKVSLVYQEWMYASQSERIVDLKATFPGSLAPTFTVHGRVDGEGMDTGAAFVAGITAPGFTIPVNVAADTDGFHGGDAGFSFASAGLSLAMPLGIDMKGGPTLGAALTGYYTNDDVIPNNPDDAFVTGNVSVSVAF